LAAGVQPNIGVQLSLEVLALFAAPDVASAPESAPVELFAETLENALTVPVEAGAELFADAPPQPPKRNDELGTVPNVFGVLQFLPIPASPVTAQPQPRRHEISISSTAPEIELLPPVPSNSGTQSFVLGPATSDFPAQPEPPSAPDTSEMLNSGQEQPSAASRPTLSATVAAVPLSGFEAVPVEPREMGTPPPNSVVPDAVVATGRFSDTLTQLKLEDQAVPEQALDRQRTDQHESDQHGTSNPLQHLPPPEAAPTASAQPLAPELSTVRDSTEDPLTRTTPAPLLSGSKPAPSHSQIYDNVSASRPVGEVVFTAELQQADQLAVPDVPEQPQREGIQPEREAVKIAGPAAVSPTNDAPVEPAAQPSETPVLRTPAPEMRSYIRTEPAPVTEPQAVTAVRDLQEQPRAAAQGVTFQIGERDERVHVHLREREGAIQVSVRTPNPDVAQSLRSGIPDLTGQLQNAGFRSEIVAPQPADLSTAPQQQDSGDTGAGNDKWAEQQDGRRRQDFERRDGDGQQRPRRPVWEDIDE
jgi:hypothetical protein